AALWLALRWLEWRSIYFPMQRMLTTPAEAGLVFEDVNFTASDGVKLHGWHLPRTDAKLTVLVCHGNAGNISDRIDKLAIFHSLGVNVFIFDYRGYGRSRGIPSEQGTYRDALAAYAWLRSEKKAQPKQIVLYGESLGCAVAVEVATQRDVGGVVLESGFTNVPDMARVIYPIIPLHLACRYRYDSLAKIGRLKAPLLILHSPDDEIVPFAQGERLFAAAPEPKRFVRLRGDHNGGFAVSEGVYREALRDFFRAL
ncbi:MAG: alpha/beta hydrolase, partial [Verrucomicrobiae bacterium]|nr:alpha/beta hydrolase [Verrucomicrobiae bacterium]